MASTAQSLSATVSENPKGAPSAVAKTRRLFPAALDAVRQKTRRQAGRDACQMRVVDLRIGTKRSGQPTDAGIEPLARHRQQLIERRQRTAKQIEFLAMAIDVTLPTGMFAGAEIRKRQHQLSTHRYGYFRGSRRCRRTTIRREIDQRDVGLVSDGGYKRNHAGRCSAHHDLFVERPQILERSASPRDDNQVGTRYRPELG